MNESVYGSYGCPRPFCALLDRTRPPGTVTPELEPWPAMPLLATDPLRFMIMLPKSAPATAGTSPRMRVEAALYPNLNSLVDLSERIPWRLNTAFWGVASVCTIRPDTLSGASL